ncbi:MAG: PD-(D/E)XK nuclease family transposase [Lachnospiraceae bacterium]|nr:PD-(D/E)XK nuclease family transposase [Lachnospiraceae bacterium]
MNNKREELIEKIREFRLLDDDFMSKVFEDDYECIELLLHIIMGKSDLKVKEAHAQYSIKNLVGRSVRLDIYAVDMLGKKYNIEVQRADKGAGAKRARYNSSVIDTNSLLPGSDINDLPETYVIFITENDVMGGNEPIYHVDRVVKEAGKTFDDEAHIIYVNGAYQDCTPLGWLMHDFSCKNPSDMHYKILADKTRYFKEDEKGVAAMCKIMEELIDGEKKEIALKMLEDGKLQKEEIAKYFGLPLEQVEELANCHAR